MTDEVKVEQIDITAKASPRPWRIVRYGDGDSLVIHDARGDWRVCFMATPGDSAGALEQIEANAKLIVSAVNARPAPAEDAVERVELAKRLFWADMLLTEDADHRIRADWRDNWWQESADMPLSGPGFVRKWLALADAALAAMQPRGEQQEWPADAAFAFGALVQKKGRASWRGKIVGWYRTDITALGYAVESAFEPGSVQIYPETALLAWDGEQQAGREATGA